MAITQKRITELDEYTQLSPSVEGYINPNAIWLAIDNSTWTESKRLSLADFLADKHWENGKVNADGNPNTIEYDSAFTSANYYLDIKAYKTTTITVGGSSVSVREQIPYHSLVQTAASFSLVLSENVGVSISYLAFE